MVRPAARRRQKGAAAAPAARTQVTNAERRRDRRNKTRSKSPHSAQSSHSSHSSRHPSRSHSPVSSRSPKTPRQWAGQHGSPGSAKQAPEIKKRMHPLLDDSDDSDGLVTKPKRPTKARRGREPVEAYMSGGLGAGDRPGMHLEWQAKERKRQKKLDEDAVARRMSMSSSFSSSSAPRTPSRLRSMLSMDPDEEAVADSEDDGAKVLVPSSQKPTKKEAAEKSRDALAKSKVKEEASQPATKKFSASEALAKSSLPTKGLSTPAPATVTNKGLAAKGMVTPGARLEDSVIPGTGLNRRVRQASILEDANDDTLYSDGDSFGLNLDDLEPADESTPLNLTKAVAGAARARSLTPGSTRSISGTPNIQVRRSSSARIEDSQPIGSDVEDEVPLPTRRASSEKQSRKSEIAKILSETMAPPMSSSVLDDEDEQEPESIRDASEVSRSRKRKSDDIETGSAPKSIIKKKSKPSTKVSTAQLQDALLPKRKQRKNAHDHSDSESSSNDEDDELSYLPPGRKPKTKPTRASTRTSKRATTTAAAKHGKAAKETKQTSRTSTFESQDPPAPTSPLSPIKASRTAAKRISSQPGGKPSTKSTTSTNPGRRSTRQNPCPPAALDSTPPGSDASPDATSSPLSTVPDLDASASEAEAEKDTGAAAATRANRNRNGYAKGKGRDVAKTRTRDDLEAQKRKFLDIDGWDLEFEEVANGTSSPGAR